MTSIRCVGHNLKHFLLLIVLQVLIVGTHVFHVDENVLEIAPVECLL